MFLDPSFLFLFYTLLSASGSLYLSPLSLSQRFLRYFVCLVYLSLCSPPIVFLSLSHSSFLFLDALISFSFLAWSVRVYLCSILLHLCYVCPFQSVWPDLAKFRYLANILTTLAKFKGFIKYLAKFWARFGKFLVLLGKFLMLWMAKYWKSNLAIWSYCFQCLCFNFL